MRRQLAGLLLRGGGGLAHALAELADQQAGQRKHQQHHDGELPVLPDHHRGQADQGDRILHDAGNRATDGVAQQIDVVEEAGDQGAGVDLLQIGEIGADQVAIHIHLGIGDDALTDAMHQDRLAIGGKAARHRHHDHGQRHPEQGGGILRHEDIVDRRLQQIGLGRYGDGDHSHQQRGQRQGRDMRANVVAQQPRHQSMARFRAVRRRRGGRGRRRRRRAYLSRAGVCLQSLDLAGRFRGRNITLRALRGKCSQARPGGA